MNAPTLARQPRLSPSAADKEQPSKDSAADGPKSASPKDAKSRSATDVKDKKSDDDLPEREPLTPELVEDEAIRGDFMLRWAAILLAFLLGCTEIFETDTLVHIKSGQNTLENFRPAMTDVFSSTAEGRSWVNLSWLFDLSLALVYNLGEWLGSGGIALSLFKATIAAAAFGVLVHISRKDVPTWWGTICGGIALLACYRQFTARPEVVTLLGLALTVAWLHRFKEEGNPKSIWRIAILFVLWSNLDPRMFLGLAVLVFYALGETLGDWLGFPGLPDQKRRKNLWLAVGVCVAASFVNPFLWHALLSPVSLFGAEYAAHQTYTGTTLRGYEEIQFRGLLDQDIWKPELITLSVGAGVLMLVTAVVTFALNFRRLDLGHVLVLLAFAAFSVLAVHELAAAAIVAAGLAALNAQEWYQHTFRQSYSVETSELIFSRGGRAVTVLAMFGIAYLAISGVDVWDMRLSRRTGVGIDPNMTSAIEGLRGELEDSYDDRPFNFILSQGDLLIWIDKKPFIDSRLDLYVNGPTDLVEQHFATRRSIVANAQGTSEASQAETWKTNLNEYRVTHVLLRLDTRLAPEPTNNNHYLNYFLLAGSREWQLAEIGPTSAVFYRRGLADDANAADWVQPRKYAAFLKNHRFNYAATAFRSSWDIPETRATWPKADSLYDRYLSRPKNRTPNAVEEAAHYSQLLSLEYEYGVRGNLTNRRLSRLLALAHLAIRNADEGLNDERFPHQAKAYRVLGRTYLTLSSLEELIVRDMAQRGGRNLTDARRQSIGLLNGELQRRRRRQAIAALGQALVRQPDDLQALQDIAQAFRVSNNYDMAIESLEKAIAIAKREGLTEDKDAKRVWESNVKMKEQLEEGIADSLKNFQRERKTVSTSEVDRFRRLQLASRARQTGLIKHAIELIEEDPECVETDASAALFWIDLLQLAGRSEEAFNEFERLQLEQAQVPSNLSGQRRDLLAYIELSRGNYLKPESLWRRDAEQFDAGRLQSIFTAVPLAMNPAGAARSELAGLESQNVGFGLWFYQRLETLRGALSSDSPLVVQLCSLYINAALSNLEAGRHAEAQTLFQKTIELSPRSPASGLALFYLAQLTGKTTAQLEPAPPKKQPKTKQPKPKQKNKPNAAKKTRP